MTLLLLLGCNNGLLGGFGGVADGIFAPFTDAEGNTGAYAQGRAIEPGCLDGVEPGGGSGADEPPVEQLCAILAEVLAQSEGSRINGSTSAFRLWSAWYDPAAGGLAGRAATQVDQSACTGDEGPPDTFEEVDTVATVEAVEADKATMTFTGEFDGTVKLHVCDEVALE